MYRIKLTAQAKKELKIIKSIYKPAVDAAFEELKEDPYIGKPLSRELIGRFTYKIGPYRIIYIVNETDKIVLVLTAGHRGGVYR